MKRPLFWVLAVVALLCAPALEGGFLTDDHHTIERGQLLHDWRNLPTLWTHNALYNTDKGKFGETAPLDMYRPIAATVFVIDHALYGKIPTGWHLTNLLLHLACVTLLFFLAKRAVGNERVAGAAALLLGIHPFTSEAFAYINGRSDLLPTLFVLATLIALERAEQPTGHGRAARAWTLWAGLLTLAACLAKETGAVCVALAIFRPRFPSEPESVPALRLRKRPVLATMGVAMVAYVVVRIIILGGLRLPSGKSHLGEALSAMPALIGIGTTDLLMPRHTAPRFFFEDVQVLGGVGGAAIVVVALAILAILFRFRRKVPLLCWSTVAYCGAAAPGALTVVFRWDGQSRYFYLPLALIATPLLILVVRAITNRRILRALGASYFVLLTVLLQPTLAAYSDDESYARAALEEFPGRSHGYMRLGLLHCQRGQYAAGIPLLTRTVQMVPEDLRWLHNLAVCHYRMNDFEQAVHYNLLGQSRFPKEVRFRQGAALSRIAIGQLDQATHDIVIGLSLEPDHQGLRNMLVDLLDRHPDPTAARARLRAAAAEVDNPLRSQLMALAEPP